MSVRKSKRIEGLVQSDIRRMTLECNRLGGINLGQGICDMPTPPEVLEATQAAVAEDLSVYSRYDGVEPLRAQIAAKMEAHNKRPTDPESEVVVTIGSTGAFACTCQAMLNPGDEVILFEPYYGYHRNTLTVAGCVPRFVPLAPPDWKLDRAMLDAVVTDKTRAILINTPSNPSGKVFGREDLEVIAGFCQENDLLAITDEIYEYIVYDDAEHISLATLPGMRERTVTMSGFSKTFSITGWRLGYAVAPPEIAGPIGLVNDLCYICAPSPLQYGVAHGMAKLNDSYYTQMRDMYQVKRDQICAVLEAAGLPPIRPQGAYYVLADVSRLGRSTAREASMAILEQVGVASVPGSAFFTGEVGESLVRFCYAKEDEVLEAACERLARLA
ncbi:MAG: aminotransferase [Myxococcales bacterium]|nr:aminotransferase [Myxococcales bacterium]